MEKDKVILTDDQLKDVSGGAQCLPLGTPPDRLCREIGSVAQCLAKSMKNMCIWTNEGCAYNPNWKGA